MPEDLDTQDEVDAKSLQIEKILSDPKHELHDKKNLIIRANRDMYQFVRKQYFLTEERPHGTFGDIWKVYLNQCQN